jgi:hypothetical protein
MQVSLKPPQNAFKHKGKKHGYYQKEQNKAQVIKNCLPES